MALDHVAQLAEVVDQQPQATLVFVGRLHCLEQIGDQILELGFLDFQRDPQGVFDRETGTSVALMALQQLPQTNDS